MCNMLSQSYVNSFSKFIFEIVRAYQGFNFTIQEKNRQNYLQLKPEKKFPDLQQIALTRPRAECVDGCLQTLTTNSGSIWSQELTIVWIYFQSAIFSKPYTYYYEDLWVFNLAWNKSLAYHVLTKVSKPLKDLKRKLDGEEALNTHLLPTTAKAARISGSPKIQLKDTAPGHVIQMAGNAMNVSCVGGFLLAMVMCLEKKHHGAHWSVLATDSCPVFFF